MGSFGLFHWIVVLVLFLLLFGGRGKISGLMGDLGEGIKAFKKGIADKPEERDPPKIITAQADKPMEEAKDKAAHG